jgi:hypothetical protein
MRESAADVAELRLLLERSRAGAGAHIRSIFDDEHTLDAEAVISTLDGIFEMHLATVARDGAPLVAPVDGIFFRGRVWFGLPAGSVRARLVRHNAKVSASFARKSFAFIVHGSAHEVGDDAAAQYFELVRELYVAAYGVAWIDWYEQLQRDDRERRSFTGWIDPRVMFVKR